jgi:hypothetical protein
MVAFISPYRSDRKQARDLSRNDGTFIEVYVDCPVTVCEGRDPKGMYQKLRRCLCGNLPHQRTMKRRNIRSYICTRVDIRLVNVVCFELFVAQR